MTDSPWQGDACSLVDAFRDGDRSPTEELAATLAAIEDSALNCISYLDGERAASAAASADLNQPFGGVPLGIKELSGVEGWPDTEASLVFKDRVCEQTDTAIERARSRGGAVLFGMTTASEFGGLNVSVTKLNGVTQNPWQEGRTAGGSSGGSAAAVAGGLCTIATGGDGGGSIRIPAGFCGLPGMKGTAGRIPRGPHTSIHPLTVVTGVMARSIRDIARYYDVTAGYDTRDPYSLLSHGRWEAELGTHREALRGKKVAIIADLGSATVLPAVAESVRSAAESLAADAGLEIVEIDFTAPSLGYEWAMGNLASLRVDLADHWPDCEGDLTKEMAVAMSLAEGNYDLDMAARAEKSRTEANETLAAAFDEVDFIISATNPDVSFPAEIGANTRVGDQKVGLENNGALTIPYNIYGNPSLSIPVMTVNDLPVGMQVATRHHDDALLFELGRIVESERPWPLTAPLAPC
ncbi:MAG: amidase [Microthrixaceae bacterium]